MVDKNVCANPQTIYEKIKGMDRHEGYFNFYWDACEGKIWL